MDTCDCCGEIIDPEQFGIPTCCTTKALEAFETLREQIKERDAIIESQLCAGCDHSAVADRGRLRDALKSIVIRCREGDKRSDWLPIIDSIASRALTDSAKRIEMTNKISGHWIENATDRVRGGEAEDVVMEDFGWVRVAERDRLRKAIQSHLKSDDASCYPKECERCDDTEGCAIVEFHQALEGESNG